jgi:hypothetical protein
MKAGFLPAFIFAGLLDKKSRLKLLTRLNLTGTEISDVSLRYITQYLSQVSLPLHKLMGDGGFDLFVYVF